MTDDTLLHIARNEDLATAKSTGRYRAASLDSEGFLHCCHPPQLSGVLDRWFRGSVELTLLTIDPEALDAQLVFENTSGGTELFPHIYGDLPMAAIVDERALEPAQGTSGEPIAP